MERVAKSERRRFRRAVVSALGVCALVAGMSGCSSEPKANPKPAHANKSFMPTPDMRGFLKDAKHCLNGGERPCAILIRTAPKLSAAYINTVPAGDEHVSWPVEAYNGKLGDPVTVDCYVNDGQPVKDYAGDPASTDWYQVEVPSELVVNPDVRQAMNQGDPSVKVINHGVETEAIGYASIIWFNQSTPDARVPLCANS